MTEFDDFRHRTSEEDLAKVAEVYQRLGNQTDVSKELGISQGCVSKRLKRAAERGLLGTFDPVMPGFRVSRTSHTYGNDGELTAEHIQQKPDLSDDPFVMPDGHVVKGVSALLDPDGRIVQQWIKTKLDGSACVIEALKKTFESYEGKSELIEAPTQLDTDLMSVYPIADQHNGLLAWGKETGDPYDLAIGADRLRKTAKRLIAQSPSSKHGMILNLGDWQHTDDARNVTPAHHNILDVDSRYFKIVTAGIQLMMDVIELGLQKHQYIFLRNLPGNHDPHSSFALTVALAAFYKNNPRVIVSQDPDEYFFHQFGQTLIGAHHGHKMKPERMAMKMASDCRKAWGETRFHWFLFGHIHHETAKEVGDCRVESFQTLASNDMFAHSHGYSSGKSLSSITLHVEDGEIGRHRVNIAPCLKEVTKTA